MLTIIKILLGLFGLTLVVLAHEIGHFIFARLCGIEVTVFSIGLGRKLFSFNWKGTEFRISLLPLGGYCKMKGEQNLIQAWEQEMKEIPREKGAFFTAHPLKRILTAFGGPLFNLIFAALIYAVLNMASYNIPYYEPRILLASELLNNGSAGDRLYPADLAGLKTGDLVTAIDGKAINRFEQLEEIVSGAEERPLRFEILRENELLTKTVVPEFKKEQGYSIIGVSPLYPPIIGRVELSSPAELAGLRPGDILLTINGNRVESSRAASLIFQRSYKDFRLTWNRNGEVLSGRLFHDSDSAAGFSWNVPVMKSETLSFFPAIREGFSEATGTVIQILKGFRILTRGVKLQNAVSGPARITWYTGEIASTMFTDGVSAGIAAWFRFIALISVALGFMNLLPVPVLDGGQIILFIVELFRRKPLHPKMIYRYQLVGTVVLAALAILALASDVFFFAGR